MRTLLVLFAAGCVVQTEPPPRRVQPAYASGPVLVVTGEPLSQPPIAVTNTRPLACTTSAIPLTTGTAYAFSPVLADGPEGLGVLWPERAPDGSCKNQSVHFGIVGTTGQLVGPPRQLSSRGDGQGPGQLVWAGDQYLATYGVAGGGIELARLGATGEPLADPIVLLAGDALLHRAVFENGTLWLAWATATAVSVRRFTPTGKALGPAVRLGVDSQNISRTGNTILQGPSGWFRFTRVGSDLAVAWAGSGYFHQRFTATGKPLGPVVKTCCAPSQSWMIGGPPALAAIGGTTSMLWMDTGQKVRPLVLTRFDRRGVELGSSEIGSAAWTAHPSAVERSGELGVAWRVMGPGGGLEFARVAADGSRIGAEQDLRPGAEGPGCDEADAVALAPTAAGYAVAWSEKQGTGYQIVLAHVCTGH